MQFKRSTKIKQRNINSEEFFLKKTAAKIRQSVSVSFEKTSGIFACKKSHYVIGLMIFSQVNFSVAQVAENALPTGGQVVAGQATISQTQTPTSATMNINQTSQRAIVNWDSFNVGKNAQVNFNQPNAQAVILNRVTGATASVIDGAVRANGQVVLVNPNGVTFGKGADINAGAVVATTMNIANKDFMEGKSTFKGNSKGAVVNQGKIAVNDPNGYIALLAPEVRNEGYLLAQKGPNNAVALAAGEQITLDFRGDKLISVNVDKAVYGALIENKRVIEVSGGLIVVAAGAANQLMGSVIKNTGRISANTMVNNGGVIELVAANVTQAGTVSANSAAVTSQTSGQTSGKGGQVHIAGENITLAANSTTTATGTAGGGSVEIGLGRTVATNTKSSAVQAVNAAASNLNTNSSIDARQAAAKQTAVVANQHNQLAKTVTVEQGALVDASATQSGNGGAIAIWSEIKTIVAGSLKATGGLQSGNGGFIETSSKGVVELAKGFVVNTSAAMGKLGTWLLDPIDLVIDAGAANVISTALQNNNVTIEVNGNVCPSLGSCTQNGSGSLTIASGADILKAGTTASTLRLISSGIFNLNADIRGENLNVIINSSIAYLNVGTSITASQVTVQAQTIHVNGNINAISNSPLNAAIQLLAQALYISGRLSASTALSNNNSNTNTNSNTVTYNGTLIRAEDLPTFLRSQNNGNANLDQVYSSTAANDNSASNINTQTNYIHLQAANDMTLYSTAQIKANGTTGGYINITAQAFNAQSGSLIQANGNNGPGGVINITTHDATLAGAISANGTNGGSFALSANNAQFEAQSVIQANGSNGPGGTISIDALQNIDFVNSGLYLNGTTNGGEIRILSRAGNLNLFNSVVQTNGSNGRGGSSIVNSQNDLVIQNSVIQLNGQDGGDIKITSNQQKVILDNSVIQTNGSSGRGGTIGIAGSTHTIQKDTHLYSKGNTAGGKVFVGYDSTGTTTIPFSRYLEIDANSSIDAQASNGPGGFIETSGYYITQLQGLVNAGQGGTWLIDPDYFIADAQYIWTALSTQNVTISTKVPANNSPAIASANGQNTTTNPGSGNITITGEIRDYPQGTGNILTLIAAGNISVGLIAMTHHNVNLQADGNITLNGVIDIGGFGLTMNAGGNIHIGGNIRLGGANISAATYSGSGSITNPFSNTGFSIGATSTTTLLSSISTNSTLVLNSAANQSFTLSNVISGSGGLTKNGDGAVILTGNNTYTGRTTVNAGTLRFAPSTNFVGELVGGIVNNANIEFNGTNGQIFLRDASGGGTWSITGAPNKGFYEHRLILIGAVTITGPVTVADNGNLFLEGTGINTSSAINLNGTNTAVNLFNLQNTEFKVGSLSGDGKVRSAREGVSLTLSLGNGNGSGTFSGVLENPSSTLNLTKAGSGTQTLSGNNTYTGVTTISAGTLSVATIGNGGVAGNLGQATNAAANLVLSGGTLLYTGASASTDRNFTLTAGTTSTISVSTAATTLTMSGASTSTTGALTKAGDGTLTLTGNNTYTGLTTVSAGTLRLAPSTTFDSTMNGGLVNNANVVFDGTNGNGVGGTFFINGASGPGTWTVTGSTTGRGLYSNRVVLVGNTTISGLVTVTGHGNFWLENESINTTSPIFLNGANTLLNLYARSTSTVTRIGALSGNGRVDAPGNVSSFTLSLGHDNGSADFAGSIVNSATTVLNLTKAGSGT